MENNAKKYISAKNKQKKRKYMKGFKKINPTMCWKKQTKK